MDKKIYSLKGNIVYSDRSELDLSDETIEISFSVESYDEKTAEKS